MALIETNYIRPQEVYDRNTGESKVRYRSYDGNDRFIPVMEGENGVPKTLVEVTHAELKAMRDGGKLTAGALYRITDYQCTTIQENTQSAGHQFDIVLLALSENKLAEEGWAMMHDNIYDVTFSDGVTKKCYFYFFPARTSDELDGYNIVDIDSKLGLQNLEVNEYVVINHENKSIQFIGEGYDALNSTDMTEENVPYNYFQNSNLAAWKVWYCLDNDTDRFAWADDSVDEDSPAFITLLGGKGEILTLYRNSAYDLNNLFAWKEGDSSPRYTASQTPSAGDTIYYGDGTDTGATVNSFTPAHEGTGPNGRGVIYRLIDEYNNDCPYDFKNIQLYLPIVEGEYVEDGQKTWVYTFCLYNKDRETYEDGSLKTIEVVVDDTYVSICNISMDAYRPNNIIYMIPFNLVLGYYSIQNEEASSPNSCLFKDSYDAVIQNVSYVYIYHTFISGYVFSDTGIFINHKKVLTGS